MSTFNIAVIIVLILIAAVVLWAAFSKPPKPPPPPTPKLTLFGVGNDKQTLYAASPPATTWSAVGPSASVAVLAYNPGDGKLYGVDENLALLSAVPGQAWAHVPNGTPSGDQISSVAFDGAGNMWGITINNFLVSKGKDPTSPWTGGTSTAVGNNIYNIDFDANGAMWGVARGSGAVFKKANASSPWVAVPNTGPATYNIHIDRKTGYFYGVGGPWQVYSSPNLATTPFTAGPVSNSVLVQDIAVAEIVPPH